MRRSAAMAAFVASILLVTAAYGSAFLPGEPPEWAAWALAVGACVSMVAMMAVGAAHRGRIGGRLVGAFVVVLAITCGGFAVLLALPPADVADPTLVLGLPPRAAVLLYGIGLLPILVVPVAYAVTFDVFTLSDEDLERVRAAGVEAARARRAGGETGEEAGEPARAGGAG